MKGIQILVALCLSLQINAQLSMNLTGETENITGQTVERVNTDGSEEIFDIEVFNQTGTARNLLVTRKRIDVPAEPWTDFLCWGPIEDPLGGSCYGASQMNTNPWTTPEAVSIPANAGGLLIVHINPNDLISGSGRYRYYFGEAGSQYIDSVDLLVTTNSLATPTISYFEEIKIYTNTSQSLCIEIPEKLKQATLQIIDLNGRIFSSIQLTESQIEMNEKFPSGIYFFRFTSGNESYTRKVSISR